MMRRGVGRVGRRGVIGTVATTAVVAGTATAVSNRVSRRQAGRAQTSADAEAYQQQQQAYEQQMAYQQQAPPPAAAPASGGLSEEDIAELQKLAALKDQGILTEEEFAAAKAKLLG